MGQTSCFLTKRQQQFSQQQDVELSQREGAPGYTGFLWQVSVTSWQRDLINIGGHCLPGLAPMVFGVFNHKTHQPPYRLEPLAEMSGQMQTQLLTVTIWVMSSQVL